jgi:Cu/Ag efflux protein CusF
MTMRILLGAIATMMILSHAASAAEAEGLIKSIDAENSVITLDNGDSYKLPGEFDVASLKEGMDILLAYDEVGGEKLITDMNVSEPAQ